MIEKRPFAALGGANHGWLATRHHFSFADYHDPGRMHWGRLRVWNASPELCELIELMGLNAALG